MPSIIAISDTHGKHHGLQVPSGDILIHAGDVSMRGSIEEVADFLAWFGSLPHKHKIFIAGNHDFLFENQASLAQEMIPEGVQYLENESIIVEGLNIWGSPITPYFHGMAFNAHRGEAIANVWEKIPAEVDVLVTHGPPADILDMTFFNGRVGCVDLKEKLKEIKPRYHIFGHIHEDRGVEQVGDTIYINASVLNLRYQLHGDPIVPIKI